MRALHLGRAMAVFGWVVMATACGNVAGSDGESADAASTFRERASHSPLNAGFLFSANAASASRRSALTSTLS